MAYVSKEMKAKIAPVVKQLCKDYGVKGTLSVRNHCALVLTISSGKIDFLEDSRDSYCEVNTYHITSRFHSEASEFLHKAVDALKGPDYFDHSNASIDFFSTSHYIKIMIGTWDKPYHYAP